MSTRNHQPECSASSNYGKSMSMSRCGEGKVMTKVPGGVGRGGFYPPPLTRLAFVYHGGDICGFILERLVGAGECTV